MANCNLQVKVAGNDNSFIAGLIDEENLLPQQSKLDIFVDQIVDQNKRDVMNRINDAIHDALLVDSTFSISDYKSDDVFIPNYSAAEFYEEFGEELELNIDPSIIPDILLINLELPEGKDLLMMQRILRPKNNGLYKKPLYIVSKSELRNLSFHLRAIDTIHRLNHIISNSSWLNKDDDELNDEEKREKELYGPFINEMISLLQETDQWLKKEKNENRLQRAKDSVIKNLFADINSKITRITRNDGRGFIYKLNNSISKYLNIEDKQDNKAIYIKDEIQETKRNLDSILQSLIASLQIVLYYGQNIDGYINKLKDIINNNDIVFSEVYKGDYVVKESYNVINNWDSNIPFSLIPITRIANQSIIDKINLIENGYDIPEEFNSIVKLLEFVLTNSKRADTIFVGNQDLKTKIINFLYTISNKRSSINNMNYTVNTINSMMRNNSILKSDLLKYFKQERKFGQNLKVDSDGDLINVLDELFILHLYKYNGCYIKDKYVIFLKSRTSNTQDIIRNYLEEGNIITNTRKALAPSITIDGNQDIYKGFYIYHFVQNDKNMWLCSLSPIFTYDNQRIFESRDDVINYINKNFHTINLAECSSVLLDLIIDALNNSLFSIKQYSTYDYHKQGDILESFDLLYNKSEIEELARIKYFPNIFTVESFYIWLTNNFELSLASKIKSQLTTPNEMALFYKLFGNVSKKTNATFYNAIKNNINDFLEKIKNAKRQYYVVVLSTHKMFHDKYFMVRKHTKFNNQKTSDKVKKEGKITITIADWTSIQKVFSANGINLLLVDSKEAIRMTGRNDWKGITQNGIIYINKDIATFDTPFHEYTHLLLGILKQTSFSQYTDLLSKYYELLKNKLKWQSGFEAKKSRYKLSELYKNINDEELIPIITEEMFADDYGMYLRLNITDASDIFHQFSSLVTQCNIFDENVTERTLFVNATKKFELFKILSEQITSSKSRNSYGFMVSKDLLSKISTKAIPVSKNNFNNLDERDNGLYKLCE